MDVSEKSKSRDRLSELPDALILSILSLLKAREVVGTTLLSKRWNGLWTTVPCLDFFTYPEFPNEFRNLVNGALALWRGTKIVKFKLVFMFNMSLTSHLDSWLLFAIKKKVEELYLNLVCDMDVVEYFEDKDYCPPQFVYSCSSITKLTLGSCKLKIEENVQWDQLRNLKIEGSEPLTADAMDRILSGAPQLEELYLYIMDTNENFNIRSSSLKKLKIKRFMTNSVEAPDSGLKIRAPNLETLKILGIPFRKCLLNVPSLNHATLGFYKEAVAPARGNKLLEDIMLSNVFLSLHHVEKITLSNWCMEVLFEMKQKARAVVFSDVKFLKINTAVANEILGVVEMFPKLIQLVVRFRNMLRFSNYISQLAFPMIGEKPPCKSESLETNPSLLHLKTVEVVWPLFRKCDASIYRCIEMILGNAEMLKQMVFRAVMFDSDELLCMAEEKILSMRRSSPTAEVVIIRRYY